MANKNYSSVTELVKATIDDKQFAKQVERRIADRQVVKHLVALRCARGMSQQDIAIRMNCSQSRVSKFESSVDADLRLGDLEAYLRAMALDAQLVVTKAANTVVEDIKALWAQLGVRLEILTELAHGDPEIATGVGRFSHELAGNFFASIAEFIDKLPKEAKRQAARMIVIE